MGEMGTVAVMGERGAWDEVRQRRMSEPGAVEAYQATRLAFELGAAVRGLREAHGWSQTHLAGLAGMTQSAVARFEAGGTIPTLPVLDRLARALDADLVVRVTARADVA
jgi:ribosome-binding protein aMBF1 (putative translation factor)